MQSLREAEHKVSVFEKLSCKHTWAYDNAANEICCESCGVVNEIETALARELEEIEDVRAHAQANSEDHNIANDSMLVPLGTDHSYRSKSSQGLGFKLGNRYGKDHQHKKVASATLQNGYPVGQYMERNGYFYEQDGKTKFKIDYTRDKSFVATMTVFNSIVSVRGREIHERARAGRIARQLYCELVVGLMPKLIAQMADLHNDPENQEALETLNSLKSELRDYMLCNGKPPKQ